MAFFTAAEALRWALEIEKNGEAFYNAVAAKSAAPSTLFRTGVEYDEYRTYLQVALADALFAGPDRGLTLANAFSQNSS